MNFQGQAKRMEGKDIETIAGYLGCHVAAVWAVLDVESAGSGFDAQGRPKMLFEPHVFYKELGPGKTRDVAVTRGVAYAKWGEKPYPNDSYPRLETAMELDETKALRSASWGLHQGMGFNHKAMGFDTVQEYVKAMTYSESAHLYAMGRFIVSKGIQRHLRLHHWASFAKVYNGAGYKKNKYDAKLKEAYYTRPSSERYTPPPTTVEDLNAMIGRVEPSRDIDMVPAPRTTPKTPWAAVFGAIVALIATFVTWLLMAD